MMRCFLTRWTVSSSLDRDRPAPRWAARHAERCEACSRFGEGVSAIDAELAGARAFASRPAALDRPRSFSRRWVFAAAAASAIVIAALWLGGDPAAPEREPPAKEASVPDVIEPAAPAEPEAVGAQEAEEPPTLWARATREGAARVPATNLEREVDRIADDARSGLEHVLRVGGLR